jgi:drug/metabolite transporter (DMT)-like permease
VDGSQTGWAVLACLGAALCYGWAASFTKKRLTGVPPLAVAAGSQAAASVLLLPLLFWCWPEQPPSARSWWAAAGLALLCTAVAYQLFFRLVARIGPANTISVTFLIPLFAVLWGWLFLGESVTNAMLVGGAVIVAGTALATGVLRGRKASAEAADGSAPR